jgi:hypothetical protein
MTGNGVKTPWVLALLCLHAYYVPQVQREWCGVGYRQANEGATMVPLPQDTDWTWCTAAPDTASNKVEEVVVLSASKILG